MPKITDPIYFVHVKKRVEELRANGAKVSDLLKEGFTLEELNAVLLDTRK